MPDKVHPLVEAESEFPMVELADVLPQLRRPFEPAAVRWKVQSAGQGWGLVIAYIDARLVIERLNLVVGGEWEDDYRAHAQGVEECALTVLGKTRKDVGTGSGPQAAKAMRSDAFKRAGVKWGIGVSIYALKAIMLNATSDREPAGDALLVKNVEKGPQGKKHWTAQLSPAAERWLSETYGRWLDARGVEKFGPPLGHGDEEGSAGMEGEEQAAPVAGGASEPEEPSGAPQLSDDRAEAARGRARGAYAAIRKMNAAQIPPAAFRARLDAVGGSHEELEAYAEELERVRGEMEEARK